MVGVELTVTDVWTLVAIVLLLAALAFLAMAETALNRISKVKAQAMAESTRSRSSRALARLASQPERFLNALLVTVTICQTAQAFLTSILAARLFGTVGVIVAFILNVIVFFVLAEAVPKTFAVLHPERAAMISTPITSALVRFPPLQLISKGLIGLTNVILPGRGLKQGPFVSEQELLGIVEAAAEDEVIEFEERELIESIIEFGDTVAREVMVPRPDMVVIPHDATVSGALDIAIEHGFSRLPVMGEGEDEVVGLGHAKDLMRAERDGKGDERAASAARPVRFIPENKPLNRLMREMQADKFHLAIVLDEYGDIAGMVTLEDCLEELVGEIVDEFDREEGREVVHLPDGSYLVDGRMSIGDLNDLLEIELPDEDWDTIAGFVFSTLGHVPVKDEAVEANGWSFAVEELDGHRIRRVRVSVVPGRLGGADTRGDAGQAEGARNRGADTAAGAPDDAAATG
jgi:CBS domain containing-hemolysin-like protein